MFSTAATYTCKHKSRVLAAQEGDCERHRFWVGSASLRDENEILLLEFNEELQESLLCAQVYSHPAGEVGSLAPSPRDPNLFFSSSSTGATLWNAAGASDAADLESSALPTPLALEPVASVAEAGVCSVLWQPLEAAAERVATYRDSVRVFDLGNSALKEACTVPVVGSSSEEPSPGSSPPAITSAAWDPHQATNVGCTYGQAASGFDLRSGKKSFHVPAAHKYTARSLDFNPNKPQFCVTSGDDRLVKFWDLRNSSVPVRELAGHSHWAWTAKYNRFHDQLLLSGGTDALVNLWRCSSVSSAPVLDADDGDTKADSGDCKVRSFEQHEESVYAVAWSACDAWVFASLDFSGRVAINHVPSAEKYKILL